MKHRRKFSDKPKAKVAIEAIKGNKTARKRVQV